MLKEMERRRRIGGEGSNRGMEENTMAILDTSGFSSSKLSHHINDDRLAFLEAVRTASLLPDNGGAPTRKMFEAIFHILKDADSLDLIIESYELLVELDKHFPRVYLSKGETSDPSSTSKVTSQCITVEEAWLPFNFGFDGRNEKGVDTNHSRNSVDSSGFHALIQEIAEEMGTGATEITSLKKMLLLQYLITVLEGDFLPRICAFQENMNWTLLRESMVNMLLGSRKIMYKGLLKDCLSIMCGMFQSTLDSEETGSNKESSAELLPEVNNAVALAFPEVKKSTCTALKKLFIMLMELDSSRRIADMMSLTTRADGIRTPVVEIVLDELLYDNDILCSFLKIFDPKWKLDIIVQYFQKYIAKSSVQTRRSSSTVNTDNFDGILKCFSNSKSTRTIIKKISAEVVQLLLAYAFQAYVALSYHVSEGLSDTMEDDKNNTVGEVCKNILAAFTRLREEDPDTEILCCVKEALFTAATILSTKS